LASLLKTVAEAAAAEQREMMEKGQEAGSLDLTVKISTIKFAGQA
jgi:hypothetical protein